MILSFLVDHILSCDILLKNSGWWLLSTFTYSYVGHAYVSQLDWDISNTPGLTEQNDVNEYPLTIKLQ